jgi:phage protein U
VPAGPAPGDRRALLVADDAAAACRRAARLVDAVADERAGVAAGARQHWRGPRRVAFDLELARVERDAAELVRSLVATAGELQAVAAGLAASRAAAP